MLNTKKYIAMYDYDNIIFVTRKVNGTEMTAKQFASMMAADYIAAFEKLNEARKQERKHRDEYYINKWQKEIDETPEKMKKKYKQEWRQKQNTEIEIKRLQKLIEDMQNKVYPSEHPGWLYFDCDLRMGRSMGTRSYSKEHLDMLEQYLLRDFEEIQKTGYYDEVKCITGWTFCCDGKYAEDGSVRSLAFRPHVKFELDDAAQQKVDEGRKKLEQSVADFYKDTKYFGD